MTKVFCILEEYTNGEGNEVYELKQIYAKENDAIQHLLDSKNDMLSYEGWQITKSNNNQTIGLARREK